MKLYIYNYLNIIDNIYYIKHFYIQINNIILTEPSYMLSYKNCVLENKQYDIENLYCYRYILGVGWMSLVQKS